MIGRGENKKSGLTKIDSPDEIYDRQVFALNLLKISDLPHKLQLPSKRLFVLLACDATNIPDQMILRFSNKLIGQGMVVFCSWGPECERVHDLVDRADHTLLKKKKKRGIVMTTWHEKESLTEALWYFQNCAFPEKGEVFGGSLLAISVGNDKWMQKIRDKLGKKN